MGYARIAIICDGKEISYGTNLFHLFMLKNDNESLKSGLADKLPADIYSVAAFRHASLPKNTFKVFVGSVQKDTNASQEIIYKQHGIIISKLGEDAISIKVVDSDSSSNVYENFLIFANEIACEYTKREQEYLLQVNVIDQNWIVKDFKPCKPQGLFRKNNAKIQQLYDCAAFVVYMNILGKLI